jgi:hypothetical protein
MSVTHSSASLHTLTWSTRIWLGFDVEDTEKAILVQQVEDNLLECVMKVARENADNILQCMQQR